MHNRTQSLYSTIPKCVWALLDVTSLKDKWATRSKKIRQYFCIAFNKEPFNYLMVSPSSHIKFTNAFTPRFDLITITAILSKLKLGCQTPSF